MTANPASLLPSILECAGPFNLFRALKLRSASQLVTGRVQAMRRSCLVLLNTFSSASAMQQCNEAGSAVLHSSYFRLHIWSSLRRPCGLGRSTSLKSKFCSKSLKSLTSLMMAGSSLKRLAMCSSSAVNRLFNCADSSSRKGITRLRFYM